MDKEKILKILWENQHEMDFGNRVITTDRFEIIADEIMELTVTVGKTFKTKEMQDLLMTGSRICESIKKSDTICKGKRLQITGQLVPFVYQELKKGRTESDLLTELEEE